MSKNSMWSLYIALPNELNCSCAGYSKRNMWNAPHMSIVSPQLESYRSKTLKKKDV